MTTNETKNLASQERGFFTLKPLYQDTLGYRGRFAPSPSGPLHFGSLIAALASYCQAKANNGVWLVRMEDIDPPREQAGADTLIMQSLAAHALYSDEAIVYQSQRLEVYAKAIDYLKQHEKIFFCSCTRKELREQLTVNAKTTIYPGTCRNKKNKTDNCSTRLLVSDAVISFQDGIYGKQTQNLSQELGDFVLRRRDGLFSYQLAVVIDDIAQGITEVVRGVDLLDSTPRQLFLYESLGYTAPNYVHLPLALQIDGKKLSKQTGARAIDDGQARQNLVRALDFLNQNPDPELIKSEPSAILQWAVANWNSAHINTESITISNY